MNILIIEDDLSVVNFLKKGLEEEDFSVFTETEGRSGLISAKTGCFDIILLDIMLPSVDGISICSALRAGGIKTPVIMLTAKNTVEDKISGLNSGADDYIVKPFEFEELVARMNALLRRSKEYSISRIFYSDLILDPATRKVSRRGIDIELSAKEFLLLEFLLKNRERIISEEEIIKSVWRSEADLFTNVVNVYIHHLRSKIDTGFEKKLIHTVRGAGYIIEER